MHVVIAINLRAQRKWFFLTTELPLYLQYQLQSVYYKLTNKPKNKIRQEITLVFLSYFSFFLFEQKSVQLNNTQYLASDFFLLQCKR